MSLLHLRAVASFSRQAAFEAERVDDASKLPDELEVLGVAHSIFLAFASKPHQIANALWLSCRSTPPHPLILSQCLLHDWNASEAFL